METARQEDYRIKRRVTWVCALLNLLLAGIKLLMGYIGQSQALIADGIHSLSDLASDAMVLVVIRIASEEADDNHPYGHARFETVATLILGLMLLLVAAGIVLDAGERILNPEKLSQPGFLALAGAAVSILVNEWMFWYSIKAANQLQSDLMRANAWHHRSDAISSVIVLIGVAGAMAGYPAMDAVGAIGVSLLIGKIGLGLAWSGVQELVDTGASPEQLEAITSAVNEVEGVMSFHDLKTRRMGQSLLVEVHVQVDSDITVSEGHLTAVRVKAGVLDRCEYVSSVLVHVDPEDDTRDRDINLLPGREEMLQRLETHWRNAGITVSPARVDLHYLKGVVDVEVVLPLEQAGSAETADKLANQLARVARHEPHIGEVRVLFRAV